MSKLMVSISESNFRLLSLEARDRGITIQELIRAVIVPDWVRFSNLQRMHRENTPLAPIPMARRENEIAPIFSRPRS